MRAAKGVGSKQAFGFGPPRQRCGCLRESVFLALARPRESDHRWSPTASRASPTSTTSGSRSRISTPPSASFVQCWEQPSFTGPRDRAGGTSCAKPSTSTRKPPSSCACSGFRRTSTWSSSNGQHRLAVWCCPRRRTSAGTTCASTSTTSTRPMRISAPLKVFGCSVQSRRSRREAPSAERDGPTSARRGACRWSSSIVPPSSADRHWCRRGRQGRYPATRPAPRARPGGAGMRLFEPGAIGGIATRNRVIMAPMTTRLATSDGYVTEQLIAYYAARAAGGTGVITVELCSPVPGGAHRRRELGIWNDKFLPGLHDLTVAIHGAGAKCSIQIGHAGAHARPDVTGAAAVAASDVPHDVREGDVQQVTPTPLTEDGMRTLVDAHAAAALRCKQAGFDMIELQGGHDYLLYQFLSPLDNKRVDAYGGALKNRARFPLQVVTACVTALGDGCPVSFRFSADEFTPGGFTLDDALELAPLLQRAGVSLINVSAGSARSVPIPSLITTPMAYPAGLFVPLAKRIKRVVSVPVAVAGRLHDPRYAESVLNDSAADFIVLGRALLADPSWPLKAQASAADRIRPCIACNTCVDHLRSGDTVVCLVNPATARESFEVPPDTTRAEGRRALVIGAGPAGLTAAAELAADGYLVTLWEKERRLGGRLQHIPKAPYFQVVETSPQPFQDLVSFLTGELHRAGVQVELGRHADAHDVEDFGADIVIDATGAVYRVPGTLHLLHLPGARYLAARPRLRKLFFKMLRNRRRGLATRIHQAPVMIVGDASGSRGVEAAIKTAHAAIQQMRVNSQERAPHIGAVTTAVKDGCMTSGEQTA